MQDYPPKELIVGYPSHSSPISAGEEEEAALDDWLVNPLFVYESTWTNYFSFYMWDYELASVTAFLSSNFLLLASRIINIIS